MANDQDRYWESRGVPRLPAEVLLLSKAQRKAWRTRYLQDLYIPDGIVGRQERSWRARHPVQVLTGSKQQTTAVPLRTVPSRPRSDSNAQHVNTSQEAAPKASAKLATPKLKPGITRLCIPPQKRWYSADGSLWRPDDRNTTTIKNTSDDEDEINEATRQLSHPASKLEHDVTIQPSPKRQKTRHVIFPPATERRLTSIPNNLGWSTGEETFRRVAAIVDRDSESDDELSDISSEDEATDRPVVRGSVAESFADQINESSPKVEKASPNSQVCDTLQKAVATGDTHVSDARGSYAMSPRNFGTGLDIMSPTFLAAINNDHQLPDADDPTQGALSILSSEGRLETHAAPETPSRLDIAVNAGRATAFFNVDAEESTQEVYEAVEEVLEEVCSSTRALPPSRSKRARMRKDPLMTKPSSHLSELVPESVIIQQDAAMPINQDVSFGDEESMAEIGEEAREVDMDDVSTDSTSDAGSNIIVTYKSAPCSQKDGHDEHVQAPPPARRPSTKSSSSPLEELSQSPTPPPHLIDPQGHTIIFSNITESQPIPASPRVIVTRTSSSKRKMTGVTSGHFSKSGHDKSAGPAWRQSRKNAAESASRADIREQSQIPAQVGMRLPNPDNGSDDDVIVVSSGRQSPQRKAHSHAVPDVEMIASHRTRPVPRANSAANQRIAYVDLTGLSSNKLIAYVDLRGGSPDVREQDPPISPPSDRDEPLEHLEKLLTSPNFVKQKEALASEIVKEQETHVATPTTPKRAPKKTTGTKSPHFITDRVDQYNTTSSSRRVPAGTSTVPFPALTCTAFGLIQEKLWQEPFWLLIAVTFLNKTTGRAAVPIFWKVKKLFPTPEKLAKANPEVLLEMVKTLGLQNARSKRLVAMAVAWVESPPIKARSFRTLNYPCRGDGRASEVPEFIEGDMDVCKGSLEIGHIPGCGSYAYDSWRIFCRDVLRGVAEDYDGKGAAGDGFEAEWKRVLPEDKELRACLRWMWLREGWVWNPLTGEKRPVEDGEQDDTLASEQVV